MAERGKSVTKPLVWALMGLLMLGLGGLGVTSFSSSLQNVATVGDKKITTNDYVRALDGELRRIGQQIGQPLTIAMAESFGLPQQVLSQLVTEAAVEEEAARIGLSIGDEEVVRALRGIAAFHSAAGQFDRETYAYALRNAGMNEEEFEDGLREQNAAALVQAAAVSNIAIGDTYADTLLAYVAERRAFTWAVVDADRLSGALPDPTEAALRAFHEENIDAYTRPLTKEIAYIWLTPEMILDTVEVEEALLRESYDERFDEFNVPERRLVERLPFLDDALASEALAAVLAGTSSFEDLVAGRGLALADTDLGDVSRDELGEAGAPVFAAEIGELIIAPSTLGPALYRVNAVLEPQSTSFEEAEPQLRDALAIDRARRVIETLAQGFDDDLAGGVALSELGDTTEAVYGTLGWTGVSDAEVSAYPAFRAAAEAVTTADFPVIDQLGDGGVFALELIEVREPEPIPFEEAQDLVTTDWLAAQELKALVAEAEMLKTKVENGESFLTLGLAPNPEQDILREDVLPGLPAAVIAKAFDLEPGALAVLDSGDTAFLVQLDSVAGPDLENPQVLAYSDVLISEATSDIAADLLAALAADIQSRVRVTLDDSAINAIHAQMQ